MDYENLQCLASALLNGVDPGDDGINGIVREIAELTAAVDRMTTVYAAVALASFAKPVDKLAPDRVMIDQTRKVLRSVLGELDVGERIKPDGGA